LLRISHFLIIRQIRTNWSWDIYSSQLLNFICLFLLIKIIYESYLFIIWKPMWKQSVCINV